MRLDVLVSASTASWMLGKMSSSPTTSESPARRHEADLGMLLAEQDIGAVLEPGAAAAVLVYENRWAGPFASAVRRSGGQLVAQGRIPTQALLAAIEAEPATDTVGA
jgi:hypothetical protein